MEMKRTTHGGFIWRFAGSCQARPVDNCRRAGLILTLYHVTPHVAHDDGGAKVSDGLRPLFINSGPTSFFLASSFSHGRAALHIYDTAPSPAK